MNGISRRCSIYYGYGQEFTIEHSGRTTPGQDGLATGRYLASISEHRDASRALGLRVVAPRALYSSSLVYPSQVPEEIGSLLRDLSVCQLIHNSRENLQVSLVLENSKYSHAGISRIYCEIPRNFLHANIWKAENLTLYMVLSQRVGKFPQKFTETLCKCS